MTAQVKRGDIYYIVGGEVTGSEQGANRPAVIVSNDTGNRYAPVVEVVYLTTRQKIEMPTHVYIGSAERPSISLCEQIVTVCKSRLERYIGSVTVEEMRQIDKALQTSLGINRAGGQAMQITMKTPFGEMKFDMPPEKATDLMQRAFQYAAGQEPEKAPQAAPLVAQEPRPTPQPINKPQSRVERLFGDFRATSSKAEMVTVGSDGRIDVTPKTAPAQREPEEYKGFLIIRCQHCGEIKGFCAKSPISTFTCGECGQRTELRNLKPLHLKCKCGSQFTYNTNIDGETFEWPCLNCGSPVDLQLNRRGDTYVTIAD